MQEGPKHAPCEKVESSAGVKYELLEVLHPEPVEKCSEKNEPSDRDAHCLGKISRTRRVAQAMNVYVPQTETYASLNGYKTYLAHGCLHLDQYDSVW